MPRSKTYDYDLVLEKAMNVFWVHGYEATSVRLLEKEMGINQFSIYASFSGNTDIQEKLHFYARRILKNLLSEQDSEIQFN